MSMCNLSSECLFRVFFNFTAINLQNVNNTMQPSYVYATFLAPMLFSTLCISHLKRLHYVRNLNCDSFLDYIS